MSVETVMPQITLQGSPDCLPCILPHPLEEAHGIAAVAGPQMQHEGQWKGEGVVWTSTQLPWAATVNEVMQNSRHLAMCLQCAY